MKPFSDGSGDLETLEKFSYIASMTAGSDLWDSRYREEGHAYGTTPSLYLMEKRPLLKRGQCVALPADGSARNAVWLAEQGLDALSLDFSTEALARGREWAAQRGVQVRFERADITQWTWPTAAFDWVVSVYCHLAPDVRARIHGEMLNALRPGGYILLEAFHKEQMAYQSGGPRDVAMLYDEALLRADFAGAEMLELRKERCELDESRLHRGPGILIRMLAQRR